jgi:transketolase
MTSNNDIVAQLQDAANRMRVSSIEQTCKANSGHPTSSCSAAEIMATLFFAEMRYDVKNPRHPAADRFILSKVFLLECFYKDE